MPSFKCKDIGMQCGFEVKDENKDELMEIAKLHAAKTHDIKEMTPEFAKQVQDAVKP